MAIYQYGLLDTLEKSLLKAEEVLRNGEGLGLLERWKQVGR
jgi:hypothetical protein